MANEIEHKYLVKPGLWKPADAGVAYRQGYLSSVKERVVRVRIAGDQAFLTIKGVTRGLTRREFEYPIPVADADALLTEICEKPLVEKTRYREKVGHHVWEIDVFHGDNDGLVLAEIEVASEAESFELPAWAGAEVSADARYFNSNLGVNPYRNWR
jgi:CYTH domain-containing protein